MSQDDESVRIPMWRRYRRFWGARVDADVDEEFEFHSEMRVHEYIERGMTEADARAAAVRRVGDLKDARTECLTIGHRRQRRMTRTQMIDAFVQDVRFGVRALRKQKSWTAVAILTLALGIGANTAVFSVVNDLLLDPLRYPNADRLVLISRANPKSGFQLTPTHQARTAWAAAHSLEAAQGLGADDLTMSGDFEPRVVHASLTEPSFFAFAGAHLLAGRSFREDESKAGAPPVVILGERMWREQYNASPAVLGRTIRLDEKTYTIVGVAPDGIRTATFAQKPTDLWIPLTSDAPFLSGPVIGLLRPGVTLEAAQKELQALSDNADRRYDAIGGTAFVVTVNRPGSRGQTRQSVMLLAWAVALLLLISCANVAHLLLARGATREREMAIRTAIGATRRRIVRQLLTESMLLAAGGCAAGLAVGFFGLRLIVALRPQSIAALVNAHVDGRVLAATVGISALSGIIFGLISAPHGVRSGGLAILRSSTGGTAGRSSHRLRSMLVITEMALSVILLVGATLLIRTVINLHRLNPGFDTNNLYAMSVALPTKHYPKVEDRDAYTTRLLDAARKYPDFAEVTVGANVPGRAGIEIGTWIAEGAAPSAPGTEGGSGGFTAMNTVRPDYFAVMRMPVIAGRTFDAGSEKRGEVIVSRALVHLLWPSAEGSAVGRRFHLAGTAKRASGPGDPGEWKTVVGVVGDASVMSLNDERHTPAIYYPSETGDGFQGPTLIVRTKSATPPFAAFRKLSLALDPNIAPPAPVRISELLIQTVSSQQFMMTLLTTFAVLAVVLSAVGLYGVISYTVSQATREIGVRIALGAGRGDVVRLVMQNGVMLAMAGLIVGLIGAAATMRLLQGSLFGVQSTDPVSYALGGGALFAIAVIACLAPTRRALRVDPVIAMRAE